MIKYFPITCPQDLTVCSHEGFWRSGSGGQESRHEES